MDRARFLGLPKVVVKVVDVIPVIVGAVWS